MFQDVYLRMEHGNRNCYKDVRQILCRIQLAIIPLTVALLSQQAKKQFLVSTYQKADDDAIVKTRKKGFRKTAKFSKSLGISLFLGFFRPFLLVSWQKTYRLCVARHDMKYVWYKGCSQFNDTPPKTEFWTPIVYKPRGCSPFNDCLL